MISKRRNDLFYVCSLIEFTGRKTKNRRRVIVKALGEAEVNHCLSFEQVSDEISDFKTGVYYQNPSYLENSYKEGYLLE